MRTSTTKLIAIAALCGTASAVGSAPAFAGGFKVSFGGGRGHVSIGHRHHNHHHHKHHHHFHHHHGHHHGVHVKKYYVAPVYKPVYVAPCIHPLHSFCFVFSGDTWYSLSMREYGKPNYAATIAAFNGLTSGMPLVVGQQLRLPVIHPNGSLTPSSAPALAPFVLPSQPALSEAISIGASTSPVVRSNAASSDAVIPTANIRQASDDRDLPSVAVGSVLALDGQSLGNENGSVRLRINGLTLPVEVLDWSTDSAKIRMPEIELDSPMEAEIEVMRADGSLASKSAIELTPAATRLALGN